MLKKLRKMQQDPSKSESVKQIYRDFVTDLEKIAHEKNPPLRVMVMNYKKTDDALKAMLRS